MNYVIFESHTDPSAPGWTPVATKASEGSSTTWRDVGPVWEERYYRIGVMGSSPMVYSPNEVGVMGLSVRGRETDEARGFAMLGMSLSSTGGTYATDLIGGQGRSTDDWDYNNADVIQQWTGLSFESAYLNDSGAGDPILDQAWLHPSDYTQTPISLEPGKAIWFQRLDTSDFTVWVDGLVSHAAASIPITVDTADRWHMLCVPYAMNLALDKQVHGTSMFADGAKASPDWDFNTGDQIKIWDPDLDAYTQEPYLNDSGGGSPSLDGNWLHPSDYTPTTAVLQKGVGFWYLSRAANPGGSWTWEEPIPY